MAESIVGGVRPGLRVLVTAGASGIGRAIAGKFHAHGARVHVCDVDEDALAACREALPDVGASRTDVGQRAEVDALFDEVERSLAGLDVLVNNAGIAGPTGGVDEIDPADWDRTIAVNLSSMFYCARRAVPLLKRTEDGAIVNISSVAGRLGFAYRTPYAASKWAVVGFSASLAKELGPLGIRANAILPGIVEGPRIDRVISARAEALGRSFEDVREENLSRVSLRRMVSGEDVANMALFLCSPAGRNITGQALSVCGNVENI